MSYLVIPTIALLCKPSHTVGSPENKKNSNSINKKNLKSDEVISHLALLLANGLPIL